MTPYPFGSDGNPASPGALGVPCDQAPVGTQCALQVTSMAFRAWNRGLAAATAADTPGNVAFGVWLFNGTTWYPDPTFPGSATCGGSTVLWAGKLDYWLIGGSSDAAQQTLCRFDGVNLVWQPLPLPPATVARLPFNSSTNKPVGGVTSGTCYAWNNCWFFGTDGIVVHWDGQTLSDASPGLGSSPWLRGDFTAAVAGTDPSGNAFGLAVTDAGTTDASHREVSGGVPLPTDPNGSPPPQLFGSQGGSFTPLSFSPPATAEPGDPFTTDLVSAGSDPQGDIWVAGDPTNRQPLQKPTPAPLLRLTERGTQAPCAGYGPGTFTYVGKPPYPSNGFQWDALAVFPNDGSVLAGGKYESNGDPEPIYHLSSPDTEPMIVRAACGQQPTVTRFTAPDPEASDPKAAPLIPADVHGSTTAVAANAANDAWASTSGGGVTSPPSGGVSQNIPQPPHMYRFTDGQAPSAPAGDDGELRPSLFTLGPPVYVPGAPTIVVLPPSVTSTVTKAPPRTIKLKPAIYAVQAPKLRRARGGKYTLSISFKVRRAVTIGIEGLRGRKVVASTGLKHFNPPRGELTLVLDRKHWPTSLRYISPKKGSG